MGARTLAAATFPPIPRPPGGAYPASRASETSKFGFPVETAPLHWEVFQISISNRDVTEIEIVIRHRNSILTSLESNEYLISIGMCFFKAHIRIEMMILFGCARKSEDKAYRRVESPGKSNRTIKHGREIRLLGITNHHLYSDV